MLSKQFLSVRLLSVICLSVSFSILCMLPAKISSLRLVVQGFSNLALKEKCRSLCWMF